MFKGVLLYRLWNFLFVNFIYLKKKDFITKGDNLDQFHMNVSEWLLINAISAIFQQYHGKNKLIFNEMMMRSALY